MRTYLATALLVACVGVGPSSALPLPSLADAPATSSDVIRVAERKCIRYEVRKKCVQMVTDITTKKPTTADPERDVNVTLRERCVKWEEERLCVQWTGDTSAVRP